MIGSLDFNQKEVTVIGGGIAGLLAAYQLNKHGYQVTLWEKEDRVGGLIHTIETPFGIVETAAHSLLASPAVVALAQELQLNLLPVQKKSRARYILRQGKLRMIPVGLGEFISILKRILTSRATTQHDNLEQWTLTHLGEVALNYLISPFLLGIYAAKPKELSPAAVFPKLNTLPGETLWHALKKNFLNPTKKGKKSKPMCAFANGSGSLVNELANYLKQSLQDRFCLNKKANELPSQGNIIIATPAYEAAQLLASQEPKLAAALKAVHYTPLIAATVFTEKRKMRFVPRGVGVLIPEVEQRDILGILFNSSAFPNRVTDESYASYTVMLGGSLKPHLIHASDNQLQDIISREFDKLFGAASAIVHMHLVRWPKALPVYNQTILQVREIALASWCAKAGKLLFGNYTGDISLRGMIEAASRLTAS